MRIRPSPIFPLSIGEETPRHVATVRFHIWSWNRLGGPPTPSKHFATSRVELEIKLKLSSNRPPTTNDHFFNFQVRGWNEVETAFCWPSTPNCHFFKFQVWSWNEVETISADLPRQTCIFQLSSLRLKPFSADLPRQTDIFQLSCLRLKWGWKIFLRPFHAKRQFFNFPPLGTLKF